MYPLPLLAKRGLTFSNHSQARIKLLILCLVIAAVPVALYVRVDSMDSRAALRCRPRSGQVVFQLSRRAGNARGLSR